MPLQHRRAIRSLDHSSLHLQHVVVRQQHNAYAHMYTWFVRARLLQQQQSIRTSHANILFMYPYYLVLLGGDDVQVHQDYVCFSVLF